MGYLDRSCRLWSPTMAAPPVVAGGAPTSAPRFSSPAAQGEQDGPMDRFGPARYSGTNILYFPVYFEIEKINILVKEETGHISKEL